MSSAMVPALELGRDAVKRHAWSEAMEAFAGVDRDAGLSADDLELMGTAAWWAGKPEDATDALERAFAAYSEAGRNLDAARVGFDLARSPAMSRPADRSRQLASPFTSPTRPSAVLRPQWVADGWRERSNSSKVFPRPRCTPG